ncbi:MAG: hypothetical protein HYV27_19305 [Candidatus Hydrogenedentes bacterium]|nr:hypothetical protein [Candidatus Hydrogenedentota bacterium]
MPILRNWLSRHALRRRSAVRIHPPAALSLPEDASLAGVPLPPFIPLPNDTPFDMLPVYRFLRDAIPDVSDAVWTWKRLCQTGFDVHIPESSSEVATLRARRLIHSLNQRMNSGDRGVDGLLDILYTSLFTYGAAACEIVLSNSRESIFDVVPVDVWTVRFRREKDGVQAYQVRGGQTIRLPKERFVYLAMDRDGTNPYGRSMLRTLPHAIKIQQRLLEDMAKATRNAGWNKLHVQYVGEERQRGESSEAFQQRMSGNLESLREKLSGLASDQNLVTFDNVKVDLLRGDQHAQGFYDNHKAVEEQIITGAHLMPILLGRNYGTTETYGTAQFEIINRQVDGINRGMEQLLERLYRFEVALMWGEAEVDVRMRRNRTVDVLKAAQAEHQEVSSLIALHGAGILDASEVLQRLDMKPACQSLACH